MENVVKITSFTAHQTPEGMRVSATYSVISPDGRLLKSNVRETRIVMVDEVNEAIDTVNTWLHGIIQNQEVTP